MNQKPIPESYWVLPDLFLAGATPVHRFDETITRQRLAGFLADGFDTFFDLSTEGDRPAYQAALKDEAGRLNRQVLYRRYSFPDFGVPRVEAMTSVLDDIDSALAQDRKVYLHCVGGIGRTGTTVGCWLVRHGMEPGKALSHLGELYRESAQSFFAPHSPETEEQARFILDWNEHGLA